MTATARDINPEQCIACGPRIALRAWNRRRDRSVIERWPAPQLPAHWLDAGSRSGGDRLPFAVQLHDGKLIGRITLRDIDIGDGDARVGVYFHPEYRGQGYGREALAAFCGHIFRTVGLAALRADVAADNTRSSRAFIACGFRVVRTFDRAGFGYVEMERRSSGHAPL